MGWKKNILMSFDMKRQYPTNQECPREKCKKNGAYLHTKNGALVKKIKLRKNLYMYIPNQYIHNRITTLTEAISGIDMS